MDELIHSYRSGDADGLSSNDLWVATRGWNHARSLSVEKVTRMLRI